MGVPKFFRWMSERYPAISQVITENRIPEFDCLYLDMNGIIHNCTHKGADNPTHRMTEDQMFIAIFNYVEHLFGKIRPQKLFFMAIDGVAPRAKMNQQRARRFRTALDAEKAREQAQAEGTELPKEDPFDSNCITPGTGFMAKLTQQLKYFINKKVSEDADWQGIDVVLSGHEVPGEGEHKIMEYIRQSKAQPGYDPNVRHCLYGLDADLIMLGLLSHDPHFCLLREEVTFGRQSKVKSKELEHQQFYLMHLCMVREYLELEFQSLKEPGVLDFELDMERVIDDFVLMAFFVGNDFLPNLPHLHINEGALSMMFEKYKVTLPKAGGYINQNGYIDMQRLGLLLDELSAIEYTVFESENSDANWLKTKSQEGPKEPPKPNKRGQLVITSGQRGIFRTIKKWVNSKNGTQDQKPFDLPSSLAAGDREFVKTLAESLHLQWKTVEDGKGDRHLQVSFPPPVDEDDEDEDEDEEAQTALFRVIKRYDNAKIVDVSAEESKTDLDRKYQEKFTAWRDHYYRDKLGWGLDSEEELRKMTENYVQGLQWVLFYYYRGVASWPWYYGYHYSPMISDIKKGFGADLDFKLGQPFRPFQQLMGVLPDRSKQIVPEPYWDLMTNPDSPIIDFYPRDFELDMNGKKQEWEAVIKIPFIQEDRLLSAMATVESKLTDAERARNDFGVTLKFTYSATTNFTYPSSLPGVFQDVPNCHCVENIYELPTMDNLEYHVGLMPGVKLGKASLAGFPSLKVLPFNADLNFHGVTVFNQESRNASMVVTIEGAKERTNVEEAKKKIGQVVHVGYPFLDEAKIVKVSDEMFDYERNFADPTSAVVPRPHDARGIEEFRKKAHRIEEVYSKRIGMVIDTVESLVHVEFLKGLKKTDQGDVVKEYGPIQGLEHEYASQMLVDKVISEDQRFVERAALPIEEEFPVDSRAFFLGPAAYGSPLQVVKHVGPDKVDVFCSMNSKRNDNWGRQLASEADHLTPYIPSYAVARQLQLNPLVLSRITSSFTVDSSSLRLNLGLNLKFESKKQKVLGYSRKSGTGWEFSQKAIELIVEYMVTFPEFFAGIQRNPKGDRFSDTDFYSKDQAADKMKEIGAWLKSIESKSFERVPLDAEQLDSNAVAQIEQTATYLKENTPAPQAKKISAAPRHALLKPADAEQRLASQIFVVGDRVCYVQDSGKVPLGLLGTVVGITKTARSTLLDVVCDDTFMSGTSLNERCSPFKGATVVSSSVLNLTNRQVLASTGKPQGLQQPQRNHNGVYVNGRGRGGYGAPSGAGSHGQLFPAQAPPALRGSFSGAHRGVTNGTSANGHAQQQVQLPIRGGRGGGNAGRGGLGLNSNPQPNRQGYTIVDGMDSEEGLSRNMNFKRQSYNAAPPPPTLYNQQGGFRGGRGGRGGRGQNVHRGRGRGAAQQQQQS